MKRKLFTFFALVSLLLGAGTVWWWTGSGKRIDQLTFERHGAQSIRLWGSGGKVMLTRTVYPASATPGSGQLAWSSIPSSPSDKTTSDKLALASFSYASEPLPDKPGGRESSLVLPAWLLTMFFALLPALWLGSKLKGKKKSS